MFPSERTVCIAARVAPWEFFFLNVLLAAFDYRRSVVVRGGGRQQPSRWLCAIRPGGLNPLFFGMNWAEDGCSVTWDISSWVCVDSHDLRAKWPRDRRMGGHAETVLRFARPAMMVNASQPHVAPGAASHGKPTAKKQPTSSDLPGLFSIVTNKIFLVWPFSSNCPQFQEQMCIERICKNLNSKWNIHAYNVIWILKDTNTPF